MLTYHTLTASAGSQFRERSNAMMRADGPAFLERIGELHCTLPAPLSFDPQPYYGTIDNPLYGLLRFAPYTAS